MSMTNSGRSRRDRMVSSTVALVSTGSVAPVAVTTMSAAASAVRSSCHATARPSSCRARALGRRQRPARDRDLPDTLRPQVDARELRHLARAEDEDAQPRQVAEDLPGELDGGVADRDGALGEAGFVAHALADRERGVEEPMGHGAREAEVARRGVGRLDLTEDLRLSDDERIEAGGDAEEMARRVDAAMAVEVLGQPRRVEAMIVAEEAAERLGGRVRIADRVDLGAVARREHDRLGADAARGERVERRVEARPSEVDGFAQLHGRRAMAEANCEKAHHSLEIVTLRQEIADRHEVQQDNHERERREPRRPPSAPADRAARKERERVHGPADASPRGSSDPRSTWPAHADRTTTGSASPRGRRWRSRASGTASRSRRRGRSSRRGPAATAGACRRSRDASP